LLVYYDFSGNENETANWWSFIIQQELEQ